MDDIDLLVVGPTGGKSGGIGRYISEQRARLDGRFSIDLFNTKTASADDAVGLLRGFVDAVLDWIQFPLRNRPDVVHVHTSHYLSFYLSSFYVLFAAYVWRRPVIVHVHGSSFDEFVSEAPTSVAALQSLVFGASDAVVVLSEYWRDVLSTRVSDRKIAVVPNAVSPEAYDPDLSTDPQHLVFVSAHIERKGIVELTEAVEKLHERGVDFRTTIAGTGPLSDHAADVADAFDDVEYVGYVSESEKRQLLSEASVYALPTYAEGLPIALLEAMAGGNAVVSTDVGSIPSVVDDENGAVVPPGDVDALSDALEQVLRDREGTRRKCAESRDRIESDYAWRDVADELAKLYERLIEPTSRPNRPDVEGTDGD
jgi:glycosyltransferase involved in cell wall biosynthesis